MLELLSPAASMEAIRAAVQNGADAVYLGFGARFHNCGAGFTETELEEAVRYCHIRGVRVYVVLNSLVTDEELASAAECARTACRLGADAAIVRDPGLITVLRQVTPDLDLHGSIRMDIHDIESVRRAQALGLKRVAVSAELSSNQIEYICANSPIEVEIFVHGELCISRSGQCYMSAFSDSGSANRGVCSRPCRLNYGYECKGRSYPLSLHNLSLISRLKELEDSSVCAIRIEERSVRPELIGIVTSVYSSAIKNRRAPSASESSRLYTGFRHGAKFTEGYFDPENSAEIFGRDELRPGSERLYAETRRGYLNEERRKIGLRFCAIIRPGEHWRLAAEDEDGNIVSAAGSVPMYSASDLDEDSFCAQLSRLGGTPYFCKGFLNYISPGVSVSTAEVIALRREVTDRLSDMRARLPERSYGVMPGIYPFPARESAPEFSFSVLHMRSLSPELAALQPRMLYVPLGELEEGAEQLAPFLQSSFTTVAAALPRAIGDGEIKDLLIKLRYARSLGIRDVLTCNFGHASYARSLGFNVHGDFGLNITNSHALECARNFGFSSAVLSPEINFREIGAISKCIDTELIVYGRVPLMTTESCIIKNRTGVCSCENVVNLVDGSGQRYPVERENGCRNLVLSPRKIFLADRAYDWNGLGLSRARLDFTTENRLECLQIARSYLGAEDFIPADFMRGLYYDGMEELTK